MHIAVCDDNIGDRKQLERLLQRESDKRASTSGVFYIDSYGSVNAVMQSPMLYDAFFIDMVSGETDGIALTRLLLQSGVTAPIVLCSSFIDYRKNLEDAPLAEDSGKFPEQPKKELHNIFFLEKPITRTALSSILDHIISLSSHVVPTIELRGEKETRYVTENDIVYARADDMYVEVYLKDSTVLRVLSSLDNFYAQLSSFTHYAAVSRNSMINVSYLQRVSLTRLTLTDGTTLRTTPSYSSDIKKALQQFVEEL